ncbi:BrnA antitoxin family protein [Aureimonas populi]|uniref:BrnA antitoxin family protein n=1 Tax=Aureimonas populi TaxID=1701758 RepID=A0ABW5CN34_9HYPH|nr:BrnA antitoxin family protein [Aureimonas populi]
MSGKPNESENTFIDPDDAPEWTEKMFAEADLYHGETLIRRGRPKVAHPKERITLRLDQDLAAALRASGRGWQTRVNQALREWIERDAANGRM